jgi:hypothetical protein
VGGGWNLLPLGAFGLQIWRTPIVGVRLNFVDMVKPHFLNIVKVMNEFYGGNIKK